MREIEHATPDMKFLPSLPRLIIWNGLGAVLILGVLVYAFYPLWGLKKILAGKEAPAPDLFSWAFFQDLPKAWEDPQRMIAVFPLLIFATLALYMLLLIPLRLREIPRFVELLPEGVNLGRWLAADKFIPYNQISGIHERPASRYVSAAFFIIDFYGKKNYIVKYAYPRWPELYQQLKLRSNF